MGRKAELVPASERRRLGSDYSWLRNNFLALLWDRSLTEIRVMDIPGIDFGKVNEEELSQSLGSYLLDRNEGIKFEKVMDNLRAGDYGLAKKMLKRWRGLLVDRKKLVNSQESVAKLGWIPWEVFVAYGEKVGLKKDGTDEVEEVVGGKNYRDRVRENFPAGVPRKRLEIYLRRQNANPRVQGVSEAVANSLDAILERDKIGQFGMGVKQILEWLEPLGGEVVVTTKRGDFEGRVRLRKGVDGEVYLKFEQVNEGEELIGNGTRVEVKVVELNEDDKQAVAGELERRFRFVPEVSIVVNGEKINGFERMKTASGGRVKTEVRGGGGGLDRRWRVSS